MENTAPQVPAEALAPKEATQQPQSPAPQAESVSPKFEALAKKEQAIVRRQQELKKLEEEYKRKEEMFKTYEQKKQTAKQNPLEALKELGLTYEEITQYILNDSKPTPELEIKSVRDELRAIREEQENKAKTERERQEQQAREQQEQVIANFKADLSDYITEHAETYELINLNGEAGVNLVFDTIQTDWQKKLEAYEESGRSGRPPKMMSTEEAAKLVEDYFDKEIERYYEKSNKIKSRFSKVDKKEDAPAKTTQEAAAQVSKTLNNSMVSPSTPSSLPAQNEADRIKRALAALDL